jgi:biopolymer transport protein ExbB/TolQ
VFFILLMVVAIVLRTNYGLALAPAICGLIAAITVYFVSNSERKNYQKRIDKGRNK